jgi:hypothetical protein
VLSPKTLLPLLIGGAAGLGGILQGLHWRSMALSSGIADLETQLRLATEENEMLKRENASLRSLAQGGGEVAVPREAIDLAEKEMGLQFLSSPVVHRIASEELRDRIAAAIESRFGPSGIDDRQEAYQLIGWIGPDDNLLAQLTLVRAVGAVGWFDDVTGEAWLTERFIADDIPDQAALLRLLCRILLHQHFPPPTAYPGDDASRAREALHHGAAAGAEARFHAASARALGFMPMRENADVEQIFNSLPTFIQGLTIFPSIEGKGLADTLHVKGDEALHAALRNPPQTTRAIMLPAAAHIPKPLEMPTPAEDPYLSESAGQLGLRLWLERLGDAGEAIEIASSWQNDRYQLLPDGEADSAVVWDIELESAEMTDRLQAAALAGISAMAGADEAPAEGTILTSPGRRHLALRRISPTRLRFIHSATRALAESYF